MFQYEKLLMGGIKVKNALNLKLDQKTCAKNLLWNISLKNKRRNSQGFKEGYKNAISLHFHLVL